MAVSRPERRSAGGRPSRIPDAGIAELRRQHVDQGVSLEELSVRSGLSVSMLSKIMLGQRRKAAGGPLRARKLRRPYSPQLKEAVRAHAAAGLSQRAIGRRYGISQGRISMILSGKAG